MNATRQFASWGRWLAARWILVIAAIIALLSLYSVNPIFGQAATPTPDIQTVPDIPALTATPVNTPFPTATPLSYEPPPTPTEESPTSTGSEEARQSAR